MKMAKHNKKRNTGLIYEFLARAIADAIIENDDRRRQIAMSIVKKHFRKDSELLKEFRLFHSLVATTTKSENVADNILEAAKEAARKINESKLDREKSLLIRSINHKINDDKFYSQKVNEYKTYATIQTLLNEWRNKGIADIVKVAQFEEILREWLMKDKNVQTLDESEASVDPLVEKLMLKKINERYGQNLNEDQSNLIKSYVFGRDEDVTKSQMLSLKEDTLKKIDVYLEGHEDPYMKGRLEKARNLIMLEGVDEVSDEKVKRFMDVAKLKQEIESKG
jgi:hypothetical protein